MDAAENIPLSHRQSLLILTYRISNNILNTILNNIYLRKMNISRYENQEKDKILKLKPRKTSLKASNLIKGNENYNAPQYYIPMPKYFSAPERPRPELKKSNLMQGDPSQLYCNNYLIRSSQNPSQREQINSIYKSAKGIIIVPNSQRSWTSVEKGR